MGNTLGTDYTITAGLWFLLICSLLQVGLVDAHTTALHLFTGIKNVSNGFLAILCKYNHHVLSPKCL